MSRILPERTLALHRKISEDNLPDRIEVFKPTQTKGIGGMVSREIGEVVATYSCRALYETDARELARGDGQEIDPTWAIVVPLRANIKIGDRAVLYGKGWKQTVDIIGSANPRTDATLRHLFADNA